MTRRGKRRSKGQRIGEQGEGLFKAWAATHSLSAQKVDNDYGIDFFCQVMEEQSRETEEITGAVLAVQVRSTAGKVKRIRIDRVDAESALRFEGPFAIAGLELDTAEVRLRFMDQPLAEELHKFLASKHKYKTWDFFDFPPLSEDLGRKLADVCAPAFQQNLRFTQAQRRLAASVPGARLRFQTDETRGVVIVEVPYVTQAFNVPAEHQDRIAKMVFDKGTFPQKGDKGFQVKPEIQALGRLVFGPTVVVGPMDRTAKVTAVAVDGTQASTTVVVRSVGDETAWVSKTGLIIAISQPRQRESLWYHNLRWRVAESAPQDLGSTADLPFLKALRPGTQLGLGDKLNLPITHFRNLEHLGEQTAQAEKVLSLLGRSLTGVFLSDVASLEFSIGAALLEALSSGIGLDQILPGFMFENDDSHTIPEGTWQDCEFTLPIVLNLANLGVVVWLEGKGHLYQSAKGICGFRTGFQRGLRYEVRSRFPHIESPQLWFCKEWPPIPIEPLARQVVQVTYTGTPLEFAGEVRMVTE